MSLVRTLVRDLGKKKEPFFKIQNGTFFNLKRGLFLQCKIWQKYYQKLREMIPFADQKRYLETCVLEWLIMS